MCPNEEPAAPAHAPLTGKVVLVTGATSGIGEVTAAELARRGARVLLGSRTLEKGQTARGRVVAQVPEASVEPVVADLRSLQQVREMAEEVSRKTKRLDILVNNAGCFRSARRVGPEGFDETWTVNYLAPFLLTRLLIPLLTQASPSRVVNVSSEAHRHARPDWADLVGFHHYSGIRAYAESKLALLLFTHELARRISSQGVSVNAVHPGLVHTGLAEEGSGMGRWVVRRTIAAAGLSPEEGAQTTLFVATSPTLEGVTGRYFAHSRLTTPSAVAEDPVVAHQLWDLSERLVRLPPLGGPEEEAAGGFEATSPALPELNLTTMGPADRMVRRPVR